MYVMDLSSTINEIDTAFLIDSGTESFSKSPISEEESEQCEDSTLSNPDGDETKLKCNNKIQLHILDKTVSVDEDELTVPLEPIRNNDQTNLINKSNENDQTNIENNELIKENKLLIKEQNQYSLLSILRRRTESSSNNDQQEHSSTDSSPPLMVLRKVSFPKLETELATYKEVDYDIPRTISTYLSADEILSRYQMSCKQHHTIELNVIKNLILDIKNNTNHSAILNLSMINITREVNETLEDLLKISNFRILILNECKYTCETIYDFFTMIEYYSSVREIEISMNFKESDAWKYFFNTCANLSILESLSLKGIDINSSCRISLLNAINTNSQITELKLDSCILEKLPFHIVDYLKKNTTVKELYLPSTGLYTKEADCLGRFLQENLYLKVLDISNNFIGDRGLEVLSKGLIKQNVVGQGLSVLVIFNNQLTEKCGHTINNIILNCKNLHTLNIGYNNLTDEVLSDIQKSLSETKSLEGLGLQCTLLTCKGLDFLAKALKNNTALKKINLKGNKAIQVQGLEKLCQALTTSKVSKIEIDETNRSANDPEAYIQMVKKMNAICEVNKSIKENDEITTISQIISRKVSLSCEPKFLIPEPQSLAASNLEQIESPMPPSSRRISSPAPKSRFQVTKVQDNKPRPISRFKVTKVIASDLDEELTTTTERFVNVRSSVSSDDSLQFDTDTN